MKKNNSYGEMYDKTCDVCKKLIKKDIYEQGTCPFCGWKNSFVGEENEDNVIYPNLISLKKAKQLYNEGKPFEPNLDEFVEALFFYSEMQFKYNNKYYGVILVRKDNKDNVIEIFEEGNEPFQTFYNKNSFKENAKINNEYLKDIWNKTTDRYWLQ